MAMATMIVVAESGGEDAISLQEMITLLVRCTSMLGKQPTTDDIAKWSQTTDVHSQANPKTNVGWSRSNVIESIANIAQLSSVEVGQWLQCVYPIHYYWEDCYWSLATNGELIESEFVDRVNSNQVMTDSVVITNWLCKRTNDLFNTTFYTI